MNGVARLQCQQLHITAAVSTAAMLYLELPMTYNIGCLLKFLAHNFVACLMRVKFAS